MIERQHTQLFFGRRGTGKSAMALSYWIGQAPWRVCIDVKDDLGERLPGVPTVDSPREILHYPTVRAVPPHPDDEAWYDELYDAAFFEGDCLLWMDELGVVTKPNYSPRAMRRYVLMGRSRLCGHIGCSPSPADVDTTYRKQAEHVYTGYLSDPLDVRTMAGLLSVPPARLEAMLETLPKYHLVYRDAVGEVEILAPMHDPDELTQRIAELHFGPYEHGE